MKRRWGPKWTGRKQAQIRWSERDPEGSRGVRDRQGREALAWGQAQPLQPVSILEGRPRLVLVHVQGHLAALPHHALGVSCVGAQGGQAGGPGDGAQGLGTLVPHHGVLGAPGQGRHQLGHGGLVLQLS